MLKYQVVDKKLETYLDLPKECDWCITHLGLFQYVSAYLILSGQNRGGHISPDQELKRLIATESITLSVVSRFLRSGLRSDGEVSWVISGKHPIEKLCASVLNSASLLEWVRLREEWTSLNLKQLSIPWGNFSRHNLWKFPRDVRERVMLTLLIMKRLKIGRDMEFLIAKYVATK